MQFFGERLRCRAVPLARRLVAPGFDDRETAWATDLLQHGQLAVAVLLAGGRGELAKHIGGTASGRRRHVEIGQDVNRGARRLGRRRLA